MYKNLLNLGHDIVQDPVFWLTIWQNSPRNHLFLFRWKHTGQVYLLHISEKLQQITNHFPLCVSVTKKRDRKESCWDKFCQASAESLRDSEKHSASSSSSPWRWSVKLHRHWEKEKCICNYFGVFWICFLEHLLPWKQKAKLSFRKVSLPSISNHTADMKSIVQELQQNH